MDRLRIVEVCAAVVVVDADPVHLAVLADLVLADDRDVVLRHARHGARAAAVAGGQVDRHAPLVAVVLVLGIERQRLRRRVPHLVDDRGLRLVRLERRLTSRVAALHRLVFLGRGDRIVLAGLRDFEAAAEPWRVGRAQQEGIELLRDADGIADAARVPASVAEEHGHRLRRLTGDDEDREDARWLRGTAVR